MLLHSKSILAKVCILLLGRLGAARLGEASALVYRTRASTRADLLTAEHTVDSSEMPLLYSAKLCEEVFERGVARLRFIFRILVDTELLLRFKVG